MATTTGYETNMEQPLELAWLPLVNGAIVLRATIIAVVIGSVLTLINQSGWVAGSEPLQLLPLILVFVTPFAVVTIAQVAGIRQAHIDSAGHGAGVGASAEGFIATVLSHGIPARAFAIGLVFGSVNAAISAADAFLRSGDLETLSIAPLGQAYALPLLFGLLSQTISYRRARYQGDPKMAANKAPKTAGERYRFDRLTPSILMGDMYYTRSDPGPGDRIPDFDMATTGGNRFRRDDLAEAAATLLVFGSYTCPVTENSAAGLRALHQEYGDRVQFVMVNVREAHPGDHVSQPDTLEEKLRHAEKMGDRHGFEFTVAADDIDGTLHRAMSPKPNSAYLLGPDGTILFRAHWANDTQRLREAIAAVANRRLLRRQKSGLRMRPMLTMIGHIDPVVEIAGPRALRELWLAAPPLAALSSLSRLFPFLSRERRGAAAVAVLTATVGVAAVVLIVLV